MKEYGWHRNISSPLLYTMFLFFFCNKNGGENNYFLVFYSNFANMQTVQTDQEFNKN